MAVTASTIIRQSAHSAVNRLLNRCLLALLALALVALAGQYAQGDSMNRQDWKVMAAVGLTLLMAACVLAAHPSVHALRAMEIRMQEQDAALGEADRQIDEMRATLENLSTIDALTGLQNHRAFQQQLESEMGRALRHGHALSLLLLDVDRFKSFNSAYGHRSGDEALRLIGSLLKENARTSDIPVRYGGEEFAVILTETDTIGAIVLGERIRQAIAAANGLPRPITASIGIATLTPNMTGVSELIAHTDRALCHAKGEGRNRVSHISRLPHPEEEQMEEEWCLTRDTISVSDLIAA